MILVASLAMGAGVIVRAAWRRRRGPRTLDAVLGRELLVSARTTSLRSS